MALRDIIIIDEDKCDGCGLCITACAEGALQLVDGKAKLVKDIYCDGLGACLGDCPQGALTVEKREAAAFDEAAVEKHLASQNPSAAPLPMAAPTQMPNLGGCPGSAMRSMRQQGAAGSAPLSGAPSLLGQWPVQLMLVPPHAPFLKDSDLVICADCVPFAVGDFHERYVAGRSLLVGCPKLDDLQHYFEKLQQTFAQAQPKRITVLKMTVPCCTGIAQAAIAARNQITPDIPLEVHTIGIEPGSEIEIEHIPAFQGKRAAGE